MQPNTNLESVMPIPPVIVTRLAKACFRFIAICCDLLRRWGLFVSGLAMRPRSPVDVRLRRAGSDPRIFSPALAILVALAALTLTACGSTVPFLSDVGLPKIPTPHLLRIEETVDRPTNLIERALSECDKRSETGEAACVKAALLDQGVSLAALIALLPSCRRGQVCHYQYTTNDLVGFYAPTSSHFIVHWRVGFDFTQSSDSIASLPITVAVV